MTNSTFNFDETLKDLQSGKNLLGTNGILTPLIKQLTEAALQAEIEHYLATTPKAIRKPIYTTNAVEAVHRQFRKLTKTKGAFPNENSLLKLLYIGIHQVSNKWTMPIANWALTLAQLAIYFKGRLDSIMTI